MPSILKLFPNELENQSKLRLKGWEKSFLAVVLFFITLEKDKHCYMCSCNDN